MSTRGTKKRTGIISGERYGSLVTVSPVGKSGCHTTWLCLCDCGDSTVSISTHLRQGRVRSCGHLKGGPNNPNWAGYKDIPANLWKELVRGADGTKGRRVLPLEITIEDLWVLWEKQGGLCAISGVELRLWPLSKKTASVDRIDGTLGYIDGNVQWVHKTVNMMKRRMSDDELVEWCRVISAWNSR